MKVSSIILPTFVLRTVKENLRLPSGQMPGRKLQARKVIAKKRGVSRSLSQAL